MTMAQKSTIFMPYSTTEVLHLNKPTSSKSLNASNIIIFAFFSSFFSRILDTLGFPSPINFLHFITVPLAFSIALSCNKSRSRRQNKIIYLLMILNLVFLFCVIVSTILNNAGIVNAVLAFLLWVEPYLLVIAILCLPTNQQIIRKFSRCIQYALIFHTLLAFVQYYGLHLYLQPGLADNIQGVFYHSGAGHVVGASVALTFGIYFFTTARRVKLSLRFTFLLATFWHVVLADAKQVLLSLIVGAILLIFTKSGKIKKLLKYIFIGCTLGVAFWWCIHNLESFRAFKTWLRPEIYGLNGEATLLKSATFRVVPQYYDSVLNWLFGLGPGHTVDRLGGWMIRQYSELLFPLGATMHEASHNIWTVVGNSWLGNQSSMFSPLFGWAALWGDFGFVGLTVYLSIGVAFYSLVCINDIAKFIIFSVFAIGWIFSQMQEPAYMLTIAVLLGLNWHEARLTGNNQRRHF